LARLEWLGQCSQIFKEVVPKIEFSSKELKTQMLLKIEVKNSNI